MKDKTHLSIRMGNELHAKFKYVSDYEGRSMSRQITYLLQQYVRQFEQEHGPIVTANNEAPQE